MYEYQVVSHYKTYQNSCRLLQISEKMIVEFVIVVGVGVFFFLCSVFVQKNFVGVGKKRGFCF